MTDIHTPCCEWVNTMKAPPPPASVTTARNFSLAAQKLESHALRVTGTCAGPMGRRG